MPIIKNHFEIFLVALKKQGNGIVESKVGLGIFNKDQFTRICQLNVSCGRCSQASVSGIVSKVDSSCEKPIWICNSNFMALVV
jgi:hypothetical protein